MPDATPPSEVEAIRRVLAEGQAMDYVDVVRAVKDQFGLSVSAGLVEQVYLQEQPAAAQPPPPRIDVAIHPSASLPAAETAPTGGESAGGASDHLAKALQFVQSVDGLGNAKRALEQLERVLQGLKS